MRSVNPLEQGQSARSGGKKCAEQGKRDLELSRLARLSSAVVQVASCRAWISLGHLARPRLTTAVFSCLFIFHALWSRSAYFTDEEAGDPRRYVETF